MATARTQVARVNKANTAAALREDADALARRALELRRRGKSWYQIAELLKLPESQIRGAADQAINAAAQLVSQGTRQELLGMEVSRLDFLQDALWDDAAAGDTRAVDSIVRIIMNRAKLLGLDEQVQTGSVTAVIVGHSEEYAAALAQINAGGMQ